jgi:peptidyl-prolyl cis-trans isomerase C
MEKASMHPIRILPVIAVLALAAACQRTGTATDPAKPAATDSAKGSVATVNGKPISREFFDFYVKGAEGKAGQPLTAEQRNEALDSLVRARVLADQAEKQGVDKETETATILELQRLGVLQNAVTKKFVEATKPTEDELRREYETQVASLSDKEYHARHILVATEDFAKNVIRRLDRGAKFEDVAKRDSTDPGSKDNGGDLGWFTPDRMVRPFSEAAMALKPGEYTKTPVQTQYGFHVIKLEETRDLKPPSFDQVQKQLDQMVRMKKFQTHVDELVKQAKVEKTL